MPHRIVLDQSVGVSGKKKDVNYKFLKIFSQTNEVNFSTEEEIVRYILEAFQII